MDTPTFITGNTSIPDSKRSAVTTKDGIATVSQCNTCGHVDSATYKGNKLFCGPRIWWKNWQTVVWISSNSGVRHLLDMTIESRPYFFPSGTATTGPSTTNPTPLPRRKLVP